eukprot:CAMPEP_0184861320 /NCGR_PEP_ID=MMETSP0580-20130426/6027_1 /TAXON_ID=1118495 /ORGANISM="Dactyliosolen fragilissimus" /LENGTH=406 /DNA_ID=CAMNT_0027358765 /DNA_START=67 /DNA_END=1287 /DNA_ORIENTATION=+
MSSTSIETIQQESTSLNEKLRRAQNILNAEGSVDPKNVIEATRVLASLQDDIRRMSIFSTNETLQDLSTASISLLSTEYHLGKSLLQQSIASSSQRKENITKATESLYGFLSRCDNLEIWKGDIQKNYHSLLDLSDRNESEEMDSNNGNGRNKARLLMTTGELRDAKIARYRLSKTLTNQKSHLNALSTQRARLGLMEHETMEGHDGEGLMRSLALSELNLYAIDAIEEIHNSNKEMEMLDMAIKLEETRNSINLHRNSMHQTNGSTSMSNMGSRYRPLPPNSKQNKPLELTHVTLDPASGQLVMKKEQVRSQVFRPGWNQPTMTLEELGDREVADAIQRSNMQKEAEERAKHAPRRYEQLVRDGMEDDSNLMDQSAVLDRQWDDWKDENPKGSGNKMGDRGDRNF